MELFMALLTLNRENDKQLSIRQQGELIRVTKAWTECQSSRIVHIKQQDKTRIVILGYTDTDHAIEWSSKVTCANEAYKQSLNWIVRGENPV